MSDGTTEVTAQDTAEDTANGTADGTTRSGAPARRRGGSRDCSPRTAPRPH